jgi:pimeloyl-ACP methyl ester carboxylesterase
MTPRYTSGLCRSFRGRDRCQARARQGGRARGGTGGRDFSGLWATTEPHRGAKDRRRLAKPRNACRCTKALKACEIALWSIDWGERQGANVQHHHIDANGVKLHVIEHGDGPVVLFCHGFPDTWRGWRRQMEAMADVGYRAVALDMRGYGESSAPNDAALYTPFYTVGDLVGVLDAFGIPTAAIVGHDFGATVAWNAAMMRPDRFTSVFCLSVPFSPPTAVSFLQQLRQAGHENFYMFRQMRPEAEAEWADAATTIPGMYYWTSGSASADQRWDPFDPARGLTRPAPAVLPEWLVGPDLSAAISEFQRTGFHGPLNYYRAIQPFFDMAGAFFGGTIRQPSFFVTGKADGLTKLRPVTEESLRQILPDLRGFLALEGIGHWPQLEATNAVNKAIKEFLAAVDTRR